MRRLAITCVNSASWTCIVCVCFACGAPSSPPLPACTALPQGPTLAVTAPLDSRPALTLTRNDGDADHVTWRLDDSGANPGDPVFIDFDVVRDGAERLAPFRPDVGAAMSLELTPTVDCGEGCDVGYVRFFDDAGAVVFEGGRAHTRDTTAEARSTGILAAHPGVDEGAPCTNGVDVRRTIPAIFFVDGGEVSLAAGARERALVDGVPFAIVAMSGVHSSVDTPVQCADCPYAPGHHEIWDTAGYAYRLAP